jgi:hypothetical protein
MVEKRPYRQQSPDSVAIAALGYLAGRPEETARFLAVTGLYPARLRAAASEPGFLAGVLDHILSDESLLLAFAAEAGLPPASVAEARHRLDPARPAG